MIIINGISNAHNHRNVPCSKRNIDVFDITDLFFFGIDTVAP